MRGFKLSSIDIWGHTFLIAVNLSIRFQIYSHWIYFVEKVYLLHLNFLATKSSIVSWHATIKLPHCGTLEIWLMRNGGFLNILSLPSVRKKTITWPAYIMHKVPLPIISYGHPTIHIVISHKPQGPPLPYHHRHLLTLTRTQADSNIVYGYAQKTATIKNIPIDSSITKPLVVPYPL